MKRDAAGSGGLGTMMEPSLSDKDARYQHLPLVGVVRDNRQRHADAAAEA
jgi:hypothetical protein